MSDNSVVKTSNPLGMTPSDIAQFVADCRILIANSKTLYEVRDALSKAVVLIESNAHETREPFRSRITIERVKELRLKHGAGPVRTIPGEGNFAFCCCCGARTKQVREFFGYNLCGKCDEASKPHEL